MSRRARILGLIAAVLVLLVAGAVWYLRPIAPVATGYAAKSHCSGIFVAGRSLESVQDDLPANPLIPLLRTSVSDADESVRVSLLGFSASTAWFTPGYGCTLADERPDLAALPELPARSDAPWPAGDGPPEDDGDRVDSGALAAALDAAFAEDDPEGRAQGTRGIVVVHDGRLVAERYADGFDAGTPQLGWSMTKSVASAMVGRLVHDGEVTIDTDSEPIWSRFDDRSAITVDQFLHMTDGLDFEESYGIQGDVTSMLYKSEDASVYAANKPVAHEPGTFRNYASGSTNLLCHLLHKVTGRYAELAHETLFAPLGLTSAVMEPDAAQGLVCSSFMYATPRDWARIGQLYLQDGEWDGERLLPEGWVEYTTEPVDVPTTEQDAHEGYGASWYVNTRADGSLWYPDMPADAFWMKGHDGQRVVVIPSADLVLVRLGFIPDVIAEERNFEQLVADVTDAVG